MTSGEAPSVQEVVEAFHRAENTLKRYERLTLKPLLPAINQLRYAGEHVALAFQVEDVTRGEELRKAKRHCERAHFDAIECAIAEILEAFHRLWDGGYAESELTAVWPEYAGIKPLLMEGQRRLISVGTLKSMDDAGREALQETLDELIEAYLALCAHLDKMDERRKRAQDVREQMAVLRERQLEAAKSKREDRRYWMGMALSAVGVLLSLLGIFLTIAEVVG